MNSDTSDQSKRKDRPGGRAERIVAAVLSATAAELARVGFAALQIDTIAHRAGVARTTIYRRWPTKTDLVRDAVRRVRAIDEPLPDTGDITADLGAFVRRLARVGTPEKRAIFRVWMAEGDHPDVAALALDMRVELDRRIIVRLRAAVDAGQLRADADLELLAETVLAAVSTRLYIRCGAVDDAFVSGLVDILLAGASHSARAEGV